MNDVKAVGLRLTEHISKTQMWLLLLLLGMGLTALRALTAGSDLSRNGVSHQAWEPWVWELSSFAVWVLCFVFLVQAFRRIEAAQLSHLKLILIHLTLSLLVSLLHVGAMVLIRKWVYLILGSVYEFGPWLQEWWYEYRKDATTYVLFLAMWLGLRALYVTPKPQVEKPHQLMVKNHHGVRWIAYADIRSIESGGNYVYLHCANEVVSYRSTLAAMEAELTAHGFIRVHRSFLVNQAAIQAAQLNSDPAQLQLTGQKTVPVSRKYKASLKKTLQLSDAKGL